MIHALKKNEEVFINEDKKTVTVKAHICCFDFDDCYDNGSNLRKVAYPFAFIGPVEFVGIARYKSDDEYDVNNAIHIAESKMERQFHKFMCRSYFDMSVNAIEEAMEYFRYAKEYSHNISKTDEHIREIAGSESKEGNISVKKSILDRSETFIDFVKVIIKVKIENLAKKKANTKKDNT